jgi:hypothetical protein
MTENQAQQEGLHFTGIYNWDKEDVKKQIADRRAKYPKARIVMVNTPPSKLSRGHHGMGYSGYADDIYSAYQTLENSTPIIDNHNTRLNSLKIEYETKVEEENKLFADHLMKVQQAKEKINAVK